jgi:aminocarboxymuconate-semialdehyde decarboxylase
MREETTMTIRCSPRREFLLGAAGLAYVAAMPSALRAAAPARKTVMIGGRRARVVDIHAHCVIPRAQDLIRGTNIEGNFADNQILSTARIQSMDQRGIDVQVLSINDYWWYAADRALAARIVRTHDEGIAEWCRAHSDRFVGLTSVALQHPDLAAEQLDYAVRQLGFRGASVGGTVRGAAPSSEKYDPFWRKAAELAVPVFMHPTNGEFLAVDRAFEGRGDLGNIVGNPFETTLFLSRLIFDGVFDRFPGLKVCGSHGGGYLPSYLGRTEVACQVRGNAMCANVKRPSEYLRTNILADAMVFSDEGLRHLVAEMGARQVVYGSDMPFNWPDMIDLVANASYLSVDDKLAILGGNLATLLRLPT